MAVGGGGGGARPSPGFGRSPTGGGYSCAPGTIAYGGQPGQLNSGGGGGYGNYSYGQTGYINYSGGEYARANSGYGPYGYGGAGQWRSPNFTGGGGGGGASCCCRPRGNSGAVPGNSYYVRVGNGGQQGGNGYRRFGRHGAVYVWQENYEQPSLSLSVSPTAIIEGQTATISWSAGGDLTGVRSPELGQNLASSGSVVVSPTSNQRYTVVAYNPVYERSRFIDLTVYRIPTATLTATPSTIVVGQSASLDWTSSDANTASINQGIGAVNVSGSLTVSPTTDITYTISVTGNGGSGSDTATITVLTIPTLNVVAPVSVDYGQDITIEVNGTNTDPSGTGVTLVTVQTDEYEGPGSTLSPIAIPNTAGNSFSTQYTIPGSSLPYDTVGPTALELKFTADGYGSLIVEETKNIDIVIDMTPDAIDIPSSEDKFLGEEPVITPDVQVTSENIVINDIDIPVEIKADSPIQVEIDGDDNWVNIRQI
tara:strand:- start:59 stop:1501 length:1443 start_codon:yes stop_codon:yes gene_type:complete